MAKQTKSKEAPAKGAEVAPAAKQQAATGGQKPAAVNSVIIPTTAGHKIKVEKPENYGGKVMVKATYDGFKAKNLRPRALTPEQAKQYMDLIAKDRTEAIKYAAAAAYPHFVNDKEYNEGIKGQVAGRDVNYIIVEKRGEVDNQGNKVPEQYVGKTFLTCGTSGDSASRVSVMLTPAEVDAYWNRAETTRSADGKTVEIGKPVSLLELANIAVSRKLKTDETRESAKTYDWGKFSMPEGAKLTAKATYVNSSQHPGRAWLNAEVNGIGIRSLMTEFQTVALKNGFATPEQIIGANKDAREKVNNILGIGAAQEETQSAGISR